MEFLHSKNFSNEGNIVTRCSIFTLSAFNGICAVVIDTLTYVYYVYISY